LDSDLGRFVSTDQPLGKRIPSDISARIPSVAHGPEMDAVVAVLLNVADDDTVRNEAANLLARSNCPQLTDTLIKVLNNPQEKPRFRAFATQHLGGQLATANSGVRSRVDSKLHQLLDDKDVEVRREALFALVEHRDQAAIQKAIACLNDPSPAGDATRDLAIRCVQEQGLRKHLPTVRKYVRDPNDVTRIAAIVALSDWGDEESRPAFEEAAKSNVVRLQRAGKAALQRLDANQSKTQN
jgi:HEAT repeat protein